MVEGFNTDYDETTAYRVRGSLLNRICRALNTMRLTFGPGVLGETSEIGTTLGVAIAEEYRPPQAQIISSANDYVTVRLIDPNGAMIGDAFNVAKPEHLWHDRGSIYGVSLSTIDADTVNATATGIDERWEINPPTVGFKVRVDRVVHTGVTVGGEDLKWTLLGPFAWADATEPAPETP